jgi:hypothetical protein
MSHRSIVDRRICVAATLALPVADLTHGGEKTFYWQY